MVQWVCIIMVTAAGATRVWAFRMVVFEGFVLGPECTSTRRCHT